MIAYFLLSLVVFYVLIQFSLAKNILISKNIENRWSDKKIPMVGGIGIFFILFVYYIIAFDFNEHFNTIFIFSFLFLELGLIDDIYCLQAEKKFRWQYYLGLIFSMLFLAISFHKLHNLLWIFLIISLCLSILVIVNAINMIDNMNGICTITIIPIVFSLYYLLPELKSFFIVLLIALAVFYFFNMRSKIYLGDSGSHLLGFLLIGFTAYFLIKDFSVRKLIGAIFIFGMPLLDMTYVVVRRILNKKPFWVGDKNHLSHEIARAFNNDVFMPNLFFFLASLMFNLIGLRIIK